MKKSVYSVVLMDSVIKAVDEQAYRLGTSRSNLINQILAEQLSCTTPEMQMRDIFSSVEELIGEAIQIQQRSASLLTMRSVLEYKYHPTISYKVELERVPGEYLGMLRVQVRTQNCELLDHFQLFFLNRLRFERRQFRARSVEYPKWALPAGCFKRSFTNAGGLSGNEAGRAIGEYIKELDLAVKSFFADPWSFDDRAPEFERRYIDMLDRYIV